MLSLPYPGNHRQPHHAHEDSHAEGELLPVRPELLWPVVHQASHQRLHAGELCVQAKIEEHDEEEKSPERRRSNCKNYLRIHKEGKSRTRLDNFSHLHSLLVSHVAQDREDYTCREYGGEGVHTADKDGVTVAVVVKLVVTSKSQKRSNSYAIGEENLSSSICKEFNIYQVKCMQSNSPIQTSAS